MSDAGRAFRDGQDEQRRLLAQHSERTAHDWAADLIIVTSRLDRLQAEVEQLRGRREVLARHVAKGDPR